MKIVFIRNCPWKSFIRTSTHAIAEQFLSAGWQGLWLGPQLTPWRVFYPSFSSERAIWTKGGVVESGMSVYSPFSVFGDRVSQLMRNSMGMRKDLSVTIPPLSSWARAKGFEEPDVVWIAHLWSAGLLSAFTGRFVVYHAHDAFSLFPEAGHRARDIEAELVSKVGLVVTTSAILAEKFKIWYGISSEKVICVPHGVDLARYSRKYPEPSDLVPLSRPRVVIIGTMDLEDPHIISELARRLPKCVFVLIGPYSNPFASTVLYRSIGNIILLGPKNKEDVPAYLSNCDVGLIAYNRDHRSTRRFGTNPMKRYEYAAACLPTVSIDLEEYRLNPSPMYLGNNIQELTNGIESALNSNTNYLLNLRRFADSSSWISRFNQIQVILSKNI